MVDGIHELVGTLIVVGVGIICLVGWLEAARYEYRRNEPLLVLAWVACPPCGVVRAGYLLAKNKI